MANGVAKNRTAELLGELLYRARKGAPIFLAAAYKVLVDEGKPELDASELTQAAETLAALWKSRLAKPDAGGSPKPYHPNEQATLDAADFERDPRTPGGFLTYMSGDGAERHSYRQLAYGALGLPTHPDVQRVLDDYQPKSG